MITNKRLQPKCDFCKNPATFDTQTVMGPWAFVCDVHFDRYSTKRQGLFSVLKVPTIEEKQCGLCDRVRPLTEFYKYTDASGTVRYRTECKECNLHERKMRSFRD